jgi:hypothetical protein
VTKAGWCKKEVLASLLSGRIDFSDRYIKPSFSGLLTDIGGKISGLSSEAQNSVTLKQLIFGEKVDSPEATTLPVRFAVSLLKDRQGEIKLNVPVSGSLMIPNSACGKAL